MACVPAKGKGKNARARKAPGAIADGAGKRGAGARPHGETRGRQEQRRGQPHTVRGDPLWKQARAK